MYADAGSPFMSRRNQGRIETRLKRCSSLLLWDDRIFPKMAKIRLRFNKEGNRKEENEMKDRGWKA